MSESPTGSFFERGLAYARANKSRLARFAVALVVLFAVTDLLSSAPQDAALALPIGELRSEAPQADQVELTISAENETDALTHTRVRLLDDRDTLRHQVHLVPGRYRIRLEMPGASAREGRFEIPAEGVVRVRLERAP